MQCQPVTRQLCSALPTFLNTQDKVCDTSYETVCTTIIATKYVKVIHSFLLVGSFKGEIPAKIGK